MYFSFFILSLTHWCSLLRLASLGAQVKVTPSVSTARTADQMTDLTAPHRCLLPVKSPLTGVSSLRRPDTPSHANATYQTLVVPVQVSGLRQKFISPPLCGSSTTILTDSPSLVDTVESSIVPVQHQFNFSGAALWPGLVGSNHGPGLDQLVNLRSAGHCSPSL